MDQSHSGTHLGLWPGGVSSVTKGTQLAPASPTPVSALPCEGTFPRPLSLGELHGELCMPFPWRSSLPGLVSITASSSFLVSWAQASSAEEEHCSEGPDLCRASVSTAPDGLLRLCNKNLRPQALLTS